MCLLTPLGTGLSLAEAGSHLEQFSSPPQAAGVSINYHGSVGMVCKLRIHVEGPGRLLAGAFRSQKWVI